jgi:hypothetical protein
MSTTISLSANDSHKIVDMAAEMLVDELRENIKKRIQEEADRRLEEWIKAILSDELSARVQASIEAILTEGFHKTNGYGQPIGERLTVRDFVLDYLAKNDGYNNSSRKDRIVSAEMERQIKKEMDDYARPKLRAEIDKVIQSKFAESLREALGLK